MLLTTVGVPFKSTAGPIFSLLGMIRGFHLGALSPFCENIDDFGDTIEDLTRSSGTIGFLSPVFDDTLTLNLDGISIKARGITGIGLRLAAVDFGKGVVSKATSRHGIPFN